MSDECVDQLGSLIHNLMRMAYNGEATLIYERAASAEEEKRRIRALKEEIMVFRATAWVILGVWIRPPFLLNDDRQTV